MKRLVVLSLLALCAPAVLRAQSPVTITGPINTPEGSALDRHPVTSRIRRSSAAA